MNAFWNFIGPLLGLGADPQDLTFIQISLRGAIVFIATLIMVRQGHKRSLSRKTAFDAVLLVILASVLSRDQRQRGIFRHARWRTGSGASPSISRVDGLSLALVRRPHQREPGGYRRKWKFRSENDVP